MPGGWSVSSGQTFLYTPEEQRLMHAARAFAQQEILPTSAEAHRRVKEIKAQHAPGPERRRLLREMARAYLGRIGEAGLTGALFPEAYGGNGRGVVADYVTLFAVTDTGTHPHKGMSTFIVPMDHPGVTIRRQLDEVIMADWMDNALIEFDDVDLPRENLLGPLHGGYHVLMDELDTERVTYCMASLGSAPRALEIAAEYSTKRVQFKQPIATFEGVSFKLAEMYTCLDAARQLIYRTAKMIDAGVPAQRESAVTKLFTAEAVWKVVDHAMQVLGGIGYTTDFPVQAIFRNARLMRIGAGSDEIMKFLIARELLKEVKGETSPGWRRH